MDVVALITAISENIGIGFILAGLAYAFYREHIVMGSQYKQEQVAREREEKRAEYERTRADRLEAALTDASKTLQEQVAVNDRTTRVLEALARGRTQHDS